MKCPNEFSCSLTCAIKNFAMPLKSQYELKISKHELDIQQQNIIWGRIRQSKKLTIFNQANEVQECMNKRLKIPYH